MSFTFHRKGSSLADMTAAIAASNMPDDVKNGVTALVNATYGSAKDCDLSIVGHEDQTGLHISNMDYRTYPSHPPHP